MVTAVESKFAVGDRVAITWEGDRPAWSIGLEKGSLATIDQGPKTDGEGKRARCQYRVHLSKGGWLWLLDKNIVLVENAPTEVAELVEKAALDLTVPTPSAPASEAKRPDILKAFPINSRIVSESDCRDSSYGEVTKHLTASLIEITWENGNAGCFHWDLIDEMRIHRVRGRSPAAKSEAEVAVALACAPAGIATDNSAPTVIDSASESIISNSKPVLAAYWVLIFEPRLHPYHLPKFTKVRVLRETSHTIRVTDGDRQWNQPKHKAWCLPRRENWNEFQSSYDDYQDALDDLAVQLRKMDRYDRLLKANPKGSNPLTPTVIEINDPDYNHQWNREDDHRWAAPTAQRFGAEKHTPVMLRTLKDDKPWGLQAQSLYFACPDDATWKRIEVCAEAAQQCANGLMDYIDCLGTYAHPAEQGKDWSDDEQPEEAIAPTSPTLETFEAIATVPAEIIPGDEERLDLLEEDIDQGLQQVEAGKAKIWQAVSEIQRHQLWRVAGHESFEAYCKTRWGWERSNAYEVAEAGKITSELQQSGIPDSELPTSVSQTRALSKVEPEKRPAVLKEAIAATGGKPTAKAIRAAAKSGIPDSDNPTEDPKLLDEVLTIDLSSYADQSDQLLCPLNPKQCWFDLMGSPTEGQMVAVLVNWPTLKVSAVLVNHKNGQTQIPVAQIYLMPGANNDA